MENRVNSPERELTIFNRWIGNLCEKGKAGEVDPQLLRSVLEPMGADFSKLTEVEKMALRKYSNKGKRQGLDAVWGKEKVDTFKNWVITEYIPYAEKKAHRKMHTFYDRQTDTYDSVKHSGMMQFLGELTAFAAGQMPKERYTRLTEDRARKGRLWDEGYTSEAYDPTDHSSFPPDFPRKAIDRLSAVL